jgi:hypothetical protein
MYHSRIKEKVERVGNVFGITMVFDMTEEDELIKDTDYIAVSSASSSISVLTRSKKSTSMATLSTPSGITICGLFVRTMFGLHSIPDQSDKTNGNKFLDRNTFDPSGLRADVPALE